MSYEIVTSIKLDKKNGKIFIASASNNAYPRYFRNWEFIERNIDYRYKFTKFVYGALSGDLQFRNSLVKYKYATNKAMEYIEDNNLNTNNYKYENGELIRTSDELYYYIDWNEPKFDEHRNNIVNIFEKSLSDMKFDLKLKVYTERDIAKLHTKALSELIQDGYTLKSDQALRGRILNTDLQKGKNDYILWTHLLNAHSILIIGLYSDNRLHGTKRINTFAEKYIVRGYPLLFVDTLCEFNQFRELADKRFALKQISRKPLSNEKIELLWKVAKKHGVNTKFKKKEITGYTLCNLILNIKARGTSFDIFLKREIQL